MISVLVPVFNTEIVTLAATLSRQMAQSSLEGEIIFLDDGSHPFWRQRNREVGALPFTTYLELPQNTGRMAVRRELAEKARFHWLLFLDGDSRILQDDFLIRYGEILNGEVEVVVGGRKYMTLKPPAPYRLHWKYGTQRESPLRVEKAFQSNNFLIRKPVFTQLLFPQDWTGYGHEDTWMGLQLAQRGVRVQEINNPVLHEGLETAEAFLQKTDEALKNLLRLSRLTHPSLLARQVRLYGEYLRLRRYRLHHLFRWLFRLFQYPLRQQLLSRRPSLVLFDLYRLGRLTEWAAKEGYPIRDR